MFALRYHGRLDMVKELLAAGASKDQLEHKTRVTLTVKCNDFLGAHFRCTDMRLLELMLASKH